MHLNLIFSSRDFELFKQYELPERLAPKAVVALVGAMDDSTNYYIKIFKL